MEQAAYLNAKKRLDCVDIRTPRAGQLRSIQRWHRLRFKSGGNMLYKAKPVQFESLGVPIVGRFYLPEAGNRVPALILCHGAGEYKENYYENRIHQYHQR